MDVSSKPHEQEWEHDGQGVVWCKGRPVDLVHAPTFGHPLTTEEVKARGAIIAAAPRVTRELRHLVWMLESLEKEGGLDVPGLATLNGARAALREAIPSATVTT